MSRRQWALVALLLLINYLIFGSLFTTVLDFSSGPHQPTRTPFPTFTPVPSPTAVVQVPTSPPSPSPTHTPTRVVVTPSPTVVLPATEPAAIAMAEAASATVGDTTLRVRAGPGTEYAVLGALAPGTTVPVIGRNADASWWQIKYEKAADDKGWISAKYSTANNTASVPLVEAPPTPPATPTPQAPPATPTPAFQYSPEAWEGQWNAGLAQIRGKIRDAAGNPVKGVFVQARCGSTVLASNPSGTNLYAPNESYEPGAYDIILSSPISPDSMCNWEVRVVDATSHEAAKDPGARALSPVGYCDLDWEEMSICFANWRKNW